MKKRRKNPDTNTSLMTFEKTISLQ